MELFKDVSIFQGIREFNTPSGVMQFKMEKNGPIHVYALDGKSYVHQGSFKRTRGQITNEWLYNEFMSQEETAE